MAYRPHPPSTPLLFGYDPERDLPRDHLARLVEHVVEAAIQPPPRPRGKGQPPFDPRLPLEVLLYGYATGIRSSRQLERLCDESLPYLFLTRGDTPSYRTLCHVRVGQSDLIEQVFVSLWAVAEAAGMKRVGHIVIDATRIRANASREAVLNREEYEPVRAELQRILTEAHVVDEREEKEGRPGEGRLGERAERLQKEQLRDMVRRVRKRLAKQKAAAKAAQAAQAAQAAPEAEESGGGVCGMSACGGVPDATAGEAADGESGGV